MARSTRRKRSRGGRMDALEKYMTDGRNSELQSHDERLEILLNPDIEKALHLLKYDQSIITKEEEERYVRFIDNVCLAIKDAYKKLVEVIKGPIEVGTNHYEKISEKYRVIFGNPKNTSSKIGSIFGISSKKTPSLNIALDTWDDINDRYRKFPPREALTRKNMTSPKGGSRRRKTRKN